MKRELKVCLERVCTQHYFCQIPYYIHTRIERELYSLIYKTRLYIERVEINVNKHVPTRDEYMSIWSVIHNPCTFDSFVINVHMHIMLYALASAPSKLCKIR